MAIDANTLPWKTGKGCWAAADTPFGQYRISVSKDVVARIGQRVVFSKQQASGWDQDAITDAVNFAKEACREDLTTLLEKTTADFAEPLSPPIDHDDNDMAVNASLAMLIASGICDEMDSDASFSDEELQIAEL